MPKRGAGRRQKRAVSEVPVEELRPHPRNPRVGDSSRISESLTRNGLYGCVVAQLSTGYILAGNHTYEAASRLGAEKVPVYWVDVDDATALRILLADNRTSDLAANDERLLAQLLGEIVREARSLLGTGYDRGDYDRLVKQALAERPAPVRGPEEDAGDEEETTWEVVAHARSDAEQRELLAELSQRGFRCRAMTA